MITAKIDSYKDRSIDADKPVKVHRNLNNGTWSVKQSGRVVGHATQIALRDVTWIVQEGGRKRVVEKGQKNVHAYAKGHLMHEDATGSTDTPDGYQVTYNPFVHETFVAFDGMPVHESEYATFEVGVNGKAVARAYGPSPE